MPQESKQLFVIVVSLLQFSSPYYDDIMYCEQNAVGARISQSLELIDEWTQKLNVQLNDGVTKIRVVHCDKN